MFHVNVSHIFYFSGAILIALNDNLELTVFMYDLHTFSKIKLICVFFFKFSHVCQMYLRD